MKQLHKMIDFTSCHSVIVVNNLRKQTELITNQNDVTSYGSFQNFQTARTAGRTNTKHPCSVPNNNRSMAASLSCSSPVTSVQLSRMVELKLELYVPFCLHACICTYCTGTLPVQTTPLQIGTNYAIHAGPDLKIHQKFLSYLSHTSS